MKTSDERKKFNSNNVVGGSTVVFCEKRPTRHPEGSNPCLVDRQRCCTELLFFIVSKRFISTRYLYPSITK